MNSLKQLINQQAKSVQLEQLHSQERLNQCSTVGNKEGDKFKIRFNIYLNFTLEKIKYGQAQLKELIHSHILISREMWTGDINSLKSVLQKGRYLRQFLLLEINEKIASLDGVIKNLQDKYLSINDQQAKDACIHELFAVMETSRQFNNLKESHLLK